MQNSLANFYIGDLIKKFHDLLNETEHKLENHEDFQSLVDFEPFKMALELMEFNRKKIPLKKKFEDTDKFLNTYIKNIYKIIEKCSVE